MNDIDTFAARIAKRIKGNSLHCVPLFFINDQLDTGSF